MNDVVTTPPSDAKSTTPNPKWSPTPTDDGGASEVIVWSKETPSTVSTAPNASQRPSVVPQKPAFSPSPLILNRNSLAGTPSSTQAPAEENGWHFISSGQLVDDTGSQYDIAEQVMKLQISDDKPAPAKPLDTNSDQTKVPNGASEETETPSTSPHNDSYVFHTRGPSSDTSSSDGTSSVVTPLHLKTQTNIPVEDGERERNGYLSEAGVRLEALHSAQKEPFAAPPEFPSLQQHSHQTYPQVPQLHGALGLGRPPHIGVVPGYDYRQHPHQHQHQHQRSDDLQVDYNIQPRPYGPGAAAPQAPQTFAPLPMHPRQDMSFRAQAPRGSISGGQYAMAPPPPSIIGSPPPAAYYQAPGLYDLVHPHPHQALRPTHHHHSASDPSSLRDIAAMHAMHSPPPMHPFTPNQGIYTPVTSPLPYGAPAQFYDRMPPPPPPPPFVGNYSMDGAGLAAGPSANNRKLGLYKTELCRSWEEKGSCRYGPKCQFAHGEEEIRKVARHPKYKTEICRTFWVSGSCPYGKRCCFIHTELPASGAPGAPGATGAAPADETRTASGSHPDGRARSMSTNSDPNDPPSSLLARISAKRNEAATTATTTGSANTPAEYASFGRPANGALRVDTAVENASKQNGGQYPYSSNPAIPAPGSELHHRMSPGPVTASADFGRGRIDVVGYNNSRIPPPNGHGHGLRHSFGGDTTITPITQRSTSGHSSPFSADGTPSKVSPAPTSGHGVPRNPLATGHSRSGSDLSMPWATQDMPARFERTWA